MRRYVRNLFEVIFICALAIALCCLFAFLVQRINPVRQHKVTIPATDEQKARKLVAYTLAE